MLSATSGSCRRLRTKNVNARIEIPCDMVRRRRPASWMLDTSWGSSSSEPMIENGSSCSRNVLIVSLIKLNWDNDEVIIDDWRLAVSSAVIGVEATEEASEKEDLPLHFDNLRLG